MIKILKLGGNITLLCILLSMLALPTGFMGIMSYEENPVVLSAQDTREEVEGDFDTTVDFPNSQVPEDIREVILRMEQEYYNPQEQQFVGDIDRSDELEQTIVQDNTSIEKEDSGIEETE